MLPLKCQSVILNCFREKEYESGLDLFVHLLDLEGQKYLPPSELVNFVVRDLVLSMDRIRVVNKAMSTLEYISSMYPTVAFSQCFFDVGPSGDFFWFLEKLYETKRFHHIEPILWFYLGILSRDEQLGKKSLVFRLFFQMSPFLFRHKLVILLDPVSQRHSYRVHQHLAIIVNMLFGLNQGFSTHRFIEVLESVLIDAGLERYSFYAILDKRLVEKRALHGFGMCLENSLQDTEISSLDLENSESVLNYALLIVSRTSKNYREMARLLDSDRWGSDVSRQIRVMIQFAELGWLSG